MNSDRRSRMQLLAHMMSLDNNLEGRDPAALDRLWSFEYNTQQTPERNVYEFFDQLEQWRGYCRRWHIANGGSTDLAKTLDTVREQQMLPKIQVFLEELKQHL
jgi:hypothetical protein